MAPKKIIVIMDHVAKDGAAKIKKKCELPLTGKGVVNKIITERALIEVTPDGWNLKKFLKGSLFKTSLTLQKLI